MSTLAKYGFLPWLRQGLSAGIIETDTLGKSAGANATRPLIRTNVHIDAHAVGGAGQPAPLEQLIQVTGPGDVTGIKPSSVVKLEPHNGVTNFEPNYLPYIEFYEEDFPWRYTPASAKGERLTPWLTLLVVEEDEFTLQNLPGSPLPVLSNGAFKSIPFPRKDQLWAWAHVHANKPLGGSAASDLRQEVDSNPNVASSRLLSARKLKANTSYAAFLIPTYEQGRLAGLGAPAERIDPVLTQQCSWDDHPDDVYAGLWPVYFDWSFRTADLADFEYLVRRIVPRIMDERVGRRPMDIQDPGYELTYPGNDDNEGGILRLEGALQTPNATAEAFIQAPDTDANKAAKEKFLSDLRDILNLNEELKEDTSPDTNTYFDKLLYPDAPADTVDDPLVLPPMYGQMHAQLNTVKLSPDAERSKWFNQVNLDPRNRVAAGFGTDVVRQHQDKYMDRAWDQVGPVRDALAKLRASRFSSEVGKKLQSGFFGKLDAASSTALTSTYHSRVAVSASATAEKVIKDQFVQPGALKAEVDNLREQLATAQSDLATAESDLAQVELDIIAKNGEINDKEGEISTAQGELADLQTELSTVNQNITNKEADITAKEGDISVAQAELNNLNTQKSDLDTDIATLEAISNPTSQQIAQLNALKTTLERVKDDIDEKKDEITTLNGELTTLKKELTALQNQKSQLKSDIEKKEDEISGLQSDLAGLESDLQDLKNQRTSLQNQITSLQNQIADLERNIASLGRLRLPSSVLQQNYRKLSRPTAPTFKRVNTPNKSALADLSARVDVDEGSPEDINPTDWNALNWGGYTFKVKVPEDTGEAATDPGLDISLSLIQSIISAQIEATKALVTQVQSAYTFLNEAATSTAEDKALLPVLTYPEFKEPTYEALINRSPELMLPNIQLIPNDTFSLLETNQRFIESYLIGLNHEMARELLWREYPTDQRGSYFRRFWDDLDNLDSTPPPPDISTLDSLTDRALGRNHPDDDGSGSRDNRLVFVIRSELLKKFPTALIYMRKAQFTGDPGSPRALADPSDPANIKTPLFKASVPPDITFIGFDIEVNHATGDLDNNPDTPNDAGWFFIVQERPGEPRFGLDLPNAEAAGGFDGITEWNDLAWQHLDIPEDEAYIDLAKLKGGSGAIALDLDDLNQSFLTKKPDGDGSSPAYQWGRNASHMAAILFQLPFMVAVHATDMVKENN